jgi:hypothetical protein
MKLLRKRINVVEEGLVLTNKTRGTLRCSHEVIAVSGDDVIECTGSGLVRRRGYGLSGCVDIYRKVLRKIGGVAERMGVGVAGGDGSLSTACM